MGLGWSGEKLGNFIFKIEWEPSITVLSEQEQNCILLTVHVFQQIYEYFLYCRLIIIWFSAVLSLVRLTVPEILFVLSKISHKCCFGIINLVTFQAQCLFFCL